MPGIQLDHLARVLIPSELTAWGERVVYTLARTDTPAKKMYSNLWAVPVGGGEAVQLTRGDHRDTTPLGDPHGRFVLFLSDRGGTSQLWRLDRDGGEARPLTAFADGSLGQVAISADGEEIVLVYTPNPGPEGTFPLAADLAAGVDPDVGTDHIPGADAAPKPEAVAKGAPRVRVYVRVRNRLDGAGWASHARPQLWRVDASSGAARRVAAGPFAWAGPSFTPRGSVLATRVGVPDGEQDVGRNEVVEVSPDGAVRVVPIPDGCAFPPTTSPDGERVGFIHLRAPDPWGGLNALPVTVELATGRATTWAAHLDRPAGDVTLDDVAGGCFHEYPLTWIPGGFVVPITDRGAVRLWEQPLDGPGRWLTPEARSVSWHQLVAGRLVGVVGSTGTFPEVARVEPDGSLRPLTRHNAALTVEVEPRTPEEVWIPVGGHHVHAWYLAPPAAGPAPAILYMHGGPHAAYGARLFFEMQWLAAQGYAVLWSNPRGSASYGEQFCACIDGDWGNLDAEDLKAAALWLGARPEVDAARVGLAGGSYGGYMSLHLAGTCDLFAAVAAQRGLFDWAADYGEGDFGFCLPEGFGDKRPWQAPEVYAAQSSLRHVEHVRVPFLVVAQEADMRCEEGQSVAVFNALRARGVPTALVIFPEEGHSMVRGGRIDRRVESMRQIEAWFRRYLVSAP